MSLSYIATVYEENHNCVSWSGISCADTEQFSEFLKTRVADRLEDEEMRELFRGHLNSLPLTGLGKDSLSAVLQADHPEERAWAAGEALAEAFLIETREITFPWNMERDKRNPFGSLPGADIVGFLGEGNDCRLALGEVKSSSEKQYPPQVMSGRSGHLGYQIDKLASDLTKMCQLLLWLLPRVKGNKYEEKYNQAVMKFFDSGNRNVALFGILIRDTQINSRDLSVRGRELRSKFSTPTSCELVALYLPWGLDQLIHKIRRGGAK